MIGSRVARSVALRATIGRSANSVNRRVDCKPRVVVQELDRQRVRLLIGFDIGRRQRGDRWLALVDLVARVPEDCRPRSIGAAGDERRHAEIAGAGRRVDERDRIADPIPETLERVRSEVPI